MLNQWKTANLDARARLWAATARNVLKRGRDKTATPQRCQLAPQRRHLPAQAGTRNDRRDAAALARLESESAEQVIEAGLWKYHRLIPAPQDSPRYARFQQMLEVFLYYTSFWLPLRVAFFAELHTPAWIAVDAADVTIDICFWLDIILTLRTAFYDHNNELNTDACIIVKRYLECWFWVDAAANFPWDCVTGIFEARHPRRCDSRNESAP